MSVHNRRNPCSRCPESVFNIPESVFNIPGISVQLRAESVFKIVRNTQLLQRAVGRLPAPVPRLRVEHVGLAPPSWLARRY